MGYIYAVQLMPESLPNRVKVGYSGDIDKRVQSFKTTCPNCRLIGEWKGDRKMESVVLDSIRRVYCHRKVRISLKSSRFYLGVIRVSGSF